VEGLRRLGRRRVVAAGFLALERLHLIAPDGRGVVRAVVRHPGAVAVVPVDGDSVVLMRQYRAAVGRALLEVPAGKLDVPGEPEVVTAHRELQEEVGLAAEAMDHLATFYTTPGFCDERMVVFVATGLSAVEATPHGPEEESAEIVRVPVADLSALLASGDLEDAKTLVALSLFAARHG
jgi:ADP-ribose pyrophosphatase